MKKTIVTGFVIFLLSASNLFANNIGDVNQSILANFNKEFADAREVDWSVKATLVKVTFKMSDQVYFAYYSKDGERVALARNILSNQLPLSLYNEVRQSYNEYWISELFEVDGKEENAYYITLENSSSIITLRSSALSGWVTYKKSDKK
jgi:hypothetical protein